MADRVLNLGYIGNGKAANRYHSPFALALPDKFRVHTMFARHVDHSMWAAIPGTRYTTEIDDVLRNPEIDIVEITTPSALHYAQAKQALEAGKHVVVDKPFSLTAAQAQELFDLASAQGVTVQCYQNRRFDSDYLTARKVFESGRLGHVFELVTAYDYFRPHMMEDAPYSQIDSAAYGHASHCLDQIISWFGVPDRVHAECRQTQGTGFANDYFDYDLYYDELGLKCTAQANYVSAFLRPSFLISGDRGAYLRMEKDQQERDLKKFYLPAGHDDFGLDALEQWGTLRWMDEDDHMHEERVEPVRSTYSAFYEALYETVAAGAPQLVTPEQTLAQMRILEQGMEGLS